MRFIYPFFSKRYISNLLGGVTIRTYDFILFQIYEKDFKLLDYIPPIQDQEIKC